MTDPLLRHSILPPCRCGGVFVREVGESIYTETVRFRCDSCGLVLDGSEEVVLHFRAWREYDKAAAGVSHNVCEINYQVPDDETRWETTKVLSHFRACVENCGNKECFYQGGAKKPEVGVVFVMPDKHMQFHCRSFRQKEGVVR